MKGKVLRLLGFLLLAVPIDVQAQFTYTTNADGVSLTITGYTGSGGTVTIPTNIDGLAVACIGDGAFTLSLRGNSDSIITSITMLEGIASIGNAAFSPGDLLPNDSLTSVTIPNTVTNIGVDAFAFCSSLTSASIPNGVTSIAGGDFFYCHSLASITIPGSVTGIGAGAFTECFDLHTIAIPYGVTSIGSDAFEFTDLSSVTIPASVTDIEAYAFAYTTLTAIYFKGNSPSTDESAFLGFNPGLIVYYLPGTTGWASFAQLTGVPTVLWNPSIQVSGANFGVSNNQFGFNISGTTNIPIVVEACTNLGKPVWTPLQSLLLTNGSVYFSEPFQSNSSERFYRISAP